jgi:hypothetical protein
LVFGEFVGVPLISTYYALRLLPYFVGDLYDFRREVLRDRDVMEEISEVDVH